MLSIVLDIAHIVCSIIIIGLGIYLIKRDK